MFPMIGYGTAMANGLIPQSISRGGLARMAPSPMKMVRPPAATAADANSARGMAQQMSQENVQAGVDPAAQAYQQYKAGFVNAAAIPAAQQPAAPQASAPMPGGAAPADPTMGPASTAISAPPPPSAPQPMAAQPPAAPQPQVAPPQQPGVATPLPGGMSPMSPTLPQGQPFGQMDLPQGDEAAMGMPNAGGQSQVSQLAGDAMQPDTGEMKFNKMVQAFAKASNSKGAFEKSSFLSPSNFAIPAMAAGTRLARHLFKKKPRHEEKEKKAWQLNTDGPRTSAIGEAKNIGFRYDRDSFAKGQAAYKSLDHFRRGKQADDGMSHQQFMDAGAWHYPPGPSLPPLSPPRLNEFSHPEFQEQALNSYYRPVHNFIQARADYESQLKPGRPPYGELGPPAPASAPGFFRSHAGGLTAAALGVPALLAAAMYLKHRREREKKAADMTNPANRHKVPASQFAMPKSQPHGMSHHEAKGKYPMPDSQHARAALGFAAMHHGKGSAEYKAVAAKAHQLGYGGTKKASAEVAQRVLSRVHDMQHSLASGHKPFFAIDMPDPDAKPANPRPAITGLH